MSASLMVKEFREWRKLEGLPWNPNFVPKEFDDIKDLEIEYWKAEDAAKEFEENQKKRAAAMPPPLPAARPRKARPLIRKGAKPGELLVRRTGSFGGDEIEALLAYVDNGLTELTKGLLDIRTKDLAEIQDALDRRLAWRGTWRAGEIYASNDLVQDQSTIWVCNAAKTEARPGSGSGWRMLVKTQTGKAK